MSNASIKQEKEAASSIGIERNEALFQQYDLRRTTNTIMKGGDGIRREREPGPVVKADSWARINSVLW